MDFKNAALSALYEKTNLSHPSAQRFAVEAMYEKLVHNSPAGVDLNPEFLKALFKCLSHGNVAVVDQAVQKLTIIVQDGRVTMDQAITELLSALPSVGSESVPCIVNGVGFLCWLQLSRIIEARRSGDATWHSADGKPSFEHRPIMHPLAKALQSRDDTCHDVVRQVAFLLLHSPSSSTSLDSLRPFLTWVLLDAPASWHSLVAPHLHGQLARLACASPALSRPIVRLLVACVPHHRLESLQERTASLAMVEEVVECIVQLEEEAEGEGKDEEGDRFQREAEAVLSALIGRCHILQASHNPLLPTLSVVKRVLRCWGESSPSFFLSLSAHVPSLALLLYCSPLEAEQRQLLLLLEVALQRNSEGNGGLTVHCGPLQTAGLQSFIEIRIFQTRISFTV